MLVYGDHWRDCDPRALLGELRTQLDAARDHAALVNAFVTASELAQGLADLDPAFDGVAMHALRSLAQSIAVSWDLGVVAIEDRVLAPLDAAALPAQIRTKRAEGYAFYALYPELYLVAGRQAPRVRTVIGLRSIGAGLAAIVSVGAGGMPMSIRPSGDPFRRTVELPGVRAPIAIVDEGPGLSGSSFGAVIDVLEQRGIHGDQITCFPSHAGELGPVASQRHRERWSRMRKIVVPFEAMLPRLTARIEALVGPLVEPLEDIAGGAWRSHHYSDETAWPPVVAHQERRKYLARTSRGTYLARFVGLGRDGIAALDRARAFASRGFTPDVVGLAHGFLVERWLGDATPLQRSAIDRRYLVERVGSYLAMRADRPAHSGASLAEQIVLVRRNTTLEIDPRVVDLEPRRRPVEVDGRLHAWEWLVLGDGTLVKTDAYDHHAAHDLIGCQDITWDVAGATIELALGPREQEWVVAIVEAATGRALDPELLRFARTAYLAFQLGRAMLASESATPEEAKRLRAAADHYRALLRG